MERINYRNKQKLEHTDPSSSDFSYEVEHFYINFTYLIIGEKLRCHIDNVKNEEKHPKKYRLGQFELAEMMLVEGDLDFYKQETVQRIIEYQWRHT